jgi:hypothetical protein
MHQDELRVIEFEGHTVVWSVGFPKDIEHLAVVVQGDRIRIQFDAQEFYDDLVRLCDELSQREFGGRQGSDTTIGHTWNYSVRLPELD